MDIQKIKDLFDLFPLTFHVTQEILDKSTLYDPTNCIGANSLREILKLNSIVANDGEEIFVFWGNIAGEILISIKETKVISLTSNKRMMELKEPTDVVFSLI